MLTNFHLFLEFQFDRNHGSNEDSFATETLTCKEVDFFAEEKDELEIIDFKDSSFKAENLDTKCDFDIPRQVVRSDSGDSASESDHNGEHHHNRNPFKG